MQAALYLDTDCVAAQEVPEPKPGPGEVLLRNRYVGICGSDTSIVHGMHPRAKPPLVLGHETAALVETASDKGTDGLEPGQPVTVFPLIVCGSCWA